MKKKKIEKFVAEMDANNCAVILIAGEGRISEKNKDFSTAVVGNFYDILMLYGMLAKHIYELCLHRMNEEEAKKLLLGFVEVATEKENRQCGNTDGLEEKGE